MPIERLKRYCSHSAKGIKRAVFLVFGFRLRRGYCGQVVSAQLQGFSNLLLRRSLAKNQKSSLRIGHSISLTALAFEKLKQNPSAEGRFYAGDLLVNVLRVSSIFWSKFPSLKLEIAGIVDEAFEVPTITKIEFESLRQAYDSFLCASASPR
jgi:hypothetical protein